MFKQETAKYQVVVYALMPVYLECHTLWGMRNKWLLEQIVALPGTWFLALHFVLSRFRALHITSFTYAVYP